MMDMFDTITPTRESNERPALMVDIDGFEGPLDVLLAMARTQKVDLQHISIVQLVDQYTDFIEEARAQRLELAADYLVMAAWLAYLKSRLLLPDPPDDEEPDPEDMAAALAARLQKLDAVRRASNLLWEQPLKRVHVFPTGHVRSFGQREDTKWTAELYDLIDAYAQIQTRQLESKITMAPREVWSLRDARDLIERALGDLSQWTPFEVVITAQAALRKTPSSQDGMLASAFAASLELVREGQAELRQEGTLGPLYLRQGSAPRRDETRDEGQT
ncbi:MAG: ScpA family protein [Pseudomonadota bacterium]